MHPLEATPTATRYQFCRPAASGRSVGRHPYTVLSYQLAGEVDYEQNGRLTLRRGDLLVIPAGQAHRITRAAGADIWSAKIETAALDPERFASVLDAVRV